jgi:hypothetical protein
MAFTDLWLAVPRELPRGPRYPKAIARGAKGGAL